MRSALPVTTRPYDVAVIGAGVFGAWTAYLLRRSGKRVLLVDAHGPGNSRSSSGDESRIIRMGYGADEIYTRSAVRSLRLWKEFFASANLSLFRPTGVLWLAHDHDRYPHKTKETLARIGVPFEELRSNDIARRYPQIGLKRICSAIFEPDSGVLMARQSVRALVRAAIENGAEYLQDSVVMKASPNANAKLREVATANGQILSAATFVFACGPWLPKLFPTLLADRIQPTRQEVFYFGAPAGNASFNASALPTWIDFKDELYCLPDIDGRGVKIAIDRHGDPFDPDSDDRLVTESGLTAVRRHLTERLPDLKDAPVTEARVCQYENTSNGDFLLDRHPGFENVWLVGGGSGHGFKHGPAVGEYIVARIDDCDEGIEPRFSLASKAAVRNRLVY